MRVKMSKQAPPAPTASAVGPCPTVIQIVGRPGTGSLPSILFFQKNPSLNFLFFFEGVKVREDFFFWGGGGGGGGGGVGGGG